MFTKAKGETFLKQSVEWGLAEIWGLTPCTGVLRNAPTQAGVGGC